MTARENAKVELVLINAFKGKYRLFVEVLHVLKCSQES